MVECRNVSVKHGVAAWCIGGAVYRPVELIDVLVQYGTVLSRIGEAKLGYVMGVYWSSEVQCCTDLYRCSPDMYGPAKVLLR